MESGAFALAGFLAAYVVTRGHRTITRWFADRGEARKTQALANKADAEARLIEAQTQAKLAVPVTPPPQAPPLQPEVAKTASTTRPLK